MKDLLIKFWRLRQNQHVILYGLSVVIGVVVAYGAIGFRELIDLAQITFLGFGGERIYDAAVATPWWRIMLGPVLGGLVVGLILRHLMQNGRALGIADTIEANALYSARMPLRQGLYSAGLSAISMGAGASTGREGPIVHLGATLAAWLGEKLKLTPALSRTVLGCGVATAVAASFNAPIAGVFFAMEVVLGHYAIHAFAPIVMASVVGTIVSRAYMGNYPAFIIPEYSFASAWDIPVIILLGVICAFVSIGFLRTILLASGLFNRIGQIPRWTHPMLGGLIVGIVALMFPQILGVGYEATDTALQGGYVLWMLLALLVLKVLMTSVSLSAGFGGGVFSPALFIGAMTGGTVGLLAAYVVPETIASHGLFAIIGMGAVAGAVLGAPISTFLIVFELVGDYQLSIAIMVATMLASVIARQSGTLSFFHGQLEQRGLRLRSGRARHIVQTMRIGEVMSSDYRSIEPTADMDDVRLRLPLAPHSLLVLQDAERRFKGMITPHSLQELEDSDKAAAEAADAAEQPSRLVYRDDPLQKALTAFDVTSEEYLPVLDNEASKAVVGLLLHRDALAAYNRVLLEERAEERGED